LFLLLTIQKTENRAFTHKEMETTSPDMKVTPKALVYITENLGKEEDAIH
jgi:hypothetical protein